MYYKDIQLHVYQSTEPMIRVVYPGVVRACGLQSAAVTLAQHDPDLEYAAQVGVNSYARVRLSFLPQEDTRVTRTVARTFTPDFNYYMDFPAPLLWSDVSSGGRHSDAVSLAELLETGELQLELWHQTPASGEEKQAAAHTAASGDVIGARLVQLTGDVMLGCVNIPLVDLLNKKTGPWSSKYWSIEMYSHVRIQVRSTWRLHLEVLFIKRNPQLPDECARLPYTHTVTPSDGCLVLQV